MSRLRCCSDSSRLPHHPIPHYGCKLGGRGSVCAVFFGAKSWWLGRALYRMIAARSRLQVRGATLQVERGSAFRLIDCGTYSASTLRDLELKSGNSRIWPKGQVQANIGSVPLALAEFISDTDGNRLLDALTEAYPFNTPPAAPSPYVTKW